MYRVGFPGWKLAAKFGVPIVVRIDAHYDRESGSYWASSPDLDGLVVTGGTLDELKNEAVAACDALLSLQLHSLPVKAAARLSYQESALQAA